MIVSLTLLVSASVFHKDQFFGMWTYTEDVVDLFDQHKVNHHLYADVQHIYLCTEPGLAYTGLMRLTV